MTRLEEQEIPDIDEEERAALDLISEAINNRDIETVRECMAIIKIPPYCLLAAKECHGADYIRDSGYNTERADKLYGPDWLNRDDI